MARTQRFVLRSTAPGLPGEWACAGCLALMTFSEPSGDSPADSAGMDHEPDCPEVQTLASEGR